MRQRLSPILSITSQHHPQTGQPAKNRGLPTLSQGAGFAPRGQSGLSPIFRPVHSPGVFIPIVAQSPGEHAAASISNLVYYIATSPANSTACEKSGTAYSVPRRRFCAAWTERAVPNFSPRPLSRRFDSHRSPMAGRACGGVYLPSCLLHRSITRKQHSLRKIGDCLLCPKAPVLRRVDRAGSPQFFAPSTHPAFSFPSLPNRGGLRRLTLARRRISPLLSMTSQPPIPPATPAGD